MENRDGQGGKGLGVTPPLPRQVYSRKVKLTSENIHLVGPPGVGKTTILLDYLGREFPGKWIYVDLLNPKYNSNWQSLSNAQLLAIDNYQKRWVPLSLQLPSPNFPTILVSRLETPTPPGFKRIELWGFDWEEFVGVQRSIDQATAHYLEWGCLPEGFWSDQFRREREWWRFLPDWQLPVEWVTTIWKILGEKITRFQLYRLLHTHLPLSKTRFYRELERLKTAGLLFEVPKFNAPSSPRKFFSYNPHFRLLVNPVKNLNYLIPALYYINRLIGQKVYYTSQFTFFLPERQLGVICSPFPNWLKLERVIIEGLKKFPNVKIEIVVFNLTEELEKWTFMENNRLKIAPFSQLFVE